MPYIDTKYIGDCDYCRHHRTGSCDTWCDCGECFEPNMTKIPLVDVVEVVRCKECKHCIDAFQDGFMYCMRPIEAEDYRETGYRFPLEVRTGIYDFCSYGKRKDGAGE